MSIFTLSRFRKDVMVATLEQFPEEYSVESKSLGTRCKLFYQSQWNSLCWTEAHDIETMLCLLKETIAMKSRVNNGVLVIQLVFGRAKQR